MTMTKRQYFLLDNMIHNYLISDYYVLCLTNPKTFDLWFKMYSIRSHAIDMEKKYGGFYYGGDGAYFSEMSDLMLRFSGIKVFANMDDRQFDHLLNVALKYEHDMLSYRDKYIKAYKHDPLQPD